MSDNTEPEKTETKLSLKDTLEKYKVHILVFIVILLIGGYIFMNKEKFMNIIKKQKSTNLIDITHSPVNDK